METGKLELIRDLSIHTPSALYSRWLVKDAEGLFHIYSSGVNGSSPVMLGLSNAEAADILSPNTPKN